MNANRRELLFKDEAHRIVGCAMEVLNTLGHGLLEKPYKNALVVEFGLQDITFRQQPIFDVQYKSVKVCEADSDKGGADKRAGIFIGPEFGTVSRPDLFAAARQAGDADFDVLIICAFNY